MDDKTINNICDLCIAKGTPLRLGTNKIVYCLIEEPLKSLEGEYRCKAYSHDDDSTRFVYHCTYEGGKHG